MSKVVYTYHDEVYELRDFYDAPELLKLWKEGWEKYGYECRVINRNHARVNPLYGEYMTHINRLYSRNPRDYENACFLRYLAMNSILQPGELGVITDADVYPVKDWDMFCSPGHLNLYSLDYIEGYAPCPCVIAADGKTFGEVVRFFMDASMWFCGSNASDQELLRTGKFPFIQHNDVVTFGDPRTYLAKAIHYKTDALRFYEGTKSKRIRHAMGV